MGICYLNITKLDILRIFRDISPEEGQRTYHPKHCGNNKDEDNSPKTLNDKNQQASSQKIRLQIISIRNIWNYINVWKIFYSEVLL